MTLGSTVVAPVAGTKHRAFGKRARTRRRQLLRLSILRKLTNQNSTSQDPRSRGSLRRGEFVVHLALEGVHLTDLDLDFIAQLENPPGAAANQLRARRIELIKIIG